MKIPSIVREIFLLIGIFLFNMLFLCTMLGTYKPSRVQIDINLHDTYFVLSSTTAILVPYLALSLFIYLIKEAFHHFKRNLQNWMILALNFLLLLQLVSLLSFISAIAIQRNGWSIYPPLTGAPAADPTVDNFSCIYIAKMMLIVLIMLFVITSILISIQIGRNQRYNHYASKPA